MKGKRAEGRTIEGKFKRGISGNPNGRPKGTTNRQKDSDAAKQEAIEQAKDDAKWRRIEIELKKLDDIYKAKVAAQIEVLLAIT